MYLFTLVRVSGPVINYLYCPSRLKWSMDVAALRSIDGVAISAENKRNRWKIANQIMFLKWAIPGLFFIFLFSIQLTANIYYKF